MKALKKITKIVFILILVLIILLLIRLCICQYRKGKAQQENEVSKIVTYNLNGEEQTVLIEGKEKNLPILVMVHGGPCFPLPFNEGCRGTFPEITQSYLTVYWDQLGCGKNRKTYADGTHLPTGIGMQDRVLVHGQVRGNMFQTQDIIDEVLNYCTDPEEKAFLESCKFKKIFSDKEAFRIEALISKYTDGFIYQGKTGEKKAIPVSLGLFCKILSVLIIILEMQ